MSYRHFSLAPLADGVWGALSGVNAGIIDLGDQTLIFDTTALPAHAREIKAAAEALTGRPATYVINSHVHPDHIQGNIVLADHATLVSSRVTRDAIAATGAQGLASMKGNRKDQENAVRQRLERLPTLTFEKQLTFHGSRRGLRLSAAVPDGDLPAGRYAGRQRGGAGGRGSADGT
jgi:cyclase